MKNRITNQKELRREFWATYPNLDRGKVTDHSGKGKMHVVDTRCVFVEWIDVLSKSGDISEELADRATL